MTLLSLSVVGSHAHALPSTVGSHISTPSHQLQPLQRHSEQCTFAYRGSQKLSHFS